MLTVSFPREREVEKRRETNKYINCFDLQLQMNAIQLILVIEQDVLSPLEIKDIFL